jgi:hypothetical protein
MAKKAGFSRQTGQFNKFFGKNQAVFEVQYSFFVLLICQKMAKKVSSQLCGDMSVFLRDFAAQKNTLPQLIEKVQKKCD